MDFLGRFSGNAWRVDGHKHPHEAGYLSLDCSKAKKKLGWYPQWSLEKALIKSIDWYKAFRGGDRMLDFTIKQIEDYEDTLSGVNSE